MNSPAVAHSSLSGKCLLVTGGYGFLAAALVARLLPVSARIVRFVRPGTSEAQSANCIGRCEVLYGDVRERESWERGLPGVDLVFHFAAQTSVYAAEKDPEEDWRTNVLPMLHLLGICRDRDWRPGILFAGSATQVGLAGRLPVDETLPDQPITTYDSHKLLAETHLEHFVRQGFARGATLRLANVYGPGPAGGKPDRGILNQMMRRALRGEPLTLYGDGAQLRDYVYVDDAIDAFLRAAASLERTSGAHFVVGSGKGHTLAQAFALVADRAALLTGSRVPVVSVSPPPGLSPIEGRHFVADASRFRAATGWSPHVPLVEGIDRTLRALQMNGGALS